MVKTVSKIEASGGVIIDCAVLQLARLKVGDEVNVEVGADGVITIEPVKNVHAMPTP